MCRQNVNYHIRGFITFSLAIESFLPKKSLQKSKKAISATGNPILWLPRTTLGASRDSSFSCRLCLVTTSGARPLLPSPGPPGPGQPGCFPGSQQRPALCAHSRLWCHVQAPAPPAGVVCTDHSAEPSGEPAGAWREPGWPRPAQRCCSCSRGFLPVLVRILQGARTGWTCRARETDLLQGTRSHDCGADQASGSVPGDAESAGVIGVQRPDSWRPPRAAMFQFKSKGRKKRCPS